MTYPIENVSGITSGIPAVLPVVYKWKTVVKFGGKTVDSSGKTVVIPLISIVISVDNSGYNTKFYH